MRIENLECRLPDRALPLTGASRFLSNPHAKILFHIADLDIEPGERVLVEGPSGCGKSTFLHILAGLLRPSSGKVLLDGWPDTQDRLDWIALNESHRAALRRDHLGIVFQGLNLIGHLTAEENAGLGLAPDAGAAGAERLQHALACLGLERLVRQRADELSMGERQRVAVARVLAATPRLILADEPTSSLDRPNAEAVLKGLFELSDAKATILVVSHDERIRERFARRIAFSDWSGT